MKRRGSRHRHTQVKPMTIRTKVMRHVVGFALLVVFFVISMVFESGKGGTLSDWSVIFYLFWAAFAYGLGFYGYPIVHSAWLDSKQ